METNRRIYLVSFGNSAEYRVDFSGTKEELETSPKLKELEASLAEYIRSKLPVCSRIKRLVTPEVREVEAGDAGKYSDYPELDEKAADALKDVVLTEALNYQDQKELDRNAPFSDIN